jgi:phage terminase small subunit
MINGFIATQAYLSAYPTATEKTAGENGHKLLKNTKIIEEIARRQEENKKKYEITKEEIVEVVKGILLDNRKNMPPFSLKAAEILNKMFGFNSADKIELSQNKEQPLFPEDE